MNRSPLLHLAAPAASVALLATLGLGGIAYAQDTGPDCAAEQQIVDSLKAGPPGTPSLADLRAALDLAVDADAHAEAQAALDARLEQIASAEVSLNACLDEGADPVPEETTDPPPDPTGEPPQPEPTTPPADTDPPYESCLEAQEAGVITPTVRGINDGYQANLDGDGDGVSCEADEGAGNGTGPGDDTTGDSGAGDFDSPATTVPRGGVDTGWVG